MYKIEDWFISITDLQKNTKSSLADIDNVRKKIILLNNKPKAVILSLDEFERLNNKVDIIPEITIDDYDKKIIENHKKSPTRWKGVEAKTFLKLLLFRKNLKIN